MKTEREVSITLDYPVQLADRLLTKVTMRRPTMKEQIDFPLDENGTFETEMKLYARLTGLSYEDILLLDMGDYENLQRQFLHFRAPEDGQRNQGANPYPVQADQVGSLRSAVP